MINKQFYVRNVDQVMALSRKVSLNVVEYPRNIMVLTDAQVKRTVQQILGLKTFSMPYLFTTNQIKMEKSNKKNREISAVMHFAPWTTSGYNVCPMASEGCKAACLNLSGNGRMSWGQIGRIKKTKLFFEHRELFARLLDIEMRYWTKHAAKRGMKLALRLNGTSDVQWEVVFPWLFTKYPDVQFYDYTKIAKRILSGRLPSNYHLTFSRTENNDAEVKKVIDNAGNVAVVFSNYKRAIRKGWNGLRVVDGVNSDRRFADKSNRILALKPLGNAKKDLTGFVLKN